MSDDNSSGHSVQRPGRKLKSAMEFGAGTEAVSFCLKDHFSVIMMIDDSEGIVEEMQRKIKSPGITSLKASQINLVNVAYSGKYDIIYSLMVLLHFWIFRQF